MKIRSAVPDDREAIGRVVGDAFGSVVQVDLVERIRASAEYVPELELVAVDGEVEGEVVGHVMLSHSRLLGPEPRPVLQLSPLSVTPGRQRDGIGGALTRAALAGSDARGEPAVFVLGHPRYYPRFGFVPAVPLGFSLEWETGDAFMVRTLDPDDPVLPGRVVFGSAFDGL